MSPIVAEKYLSVDEFWALLQTPEYHEFQTQNQ